MLQYHNGNAIGQWNPVLMDLCRNIDLTTVFTISIYYWHKKLPVDSASTKALECYCTVATVEVVVLLCLVFCVVLIYSCKCTVHTVL